MTRKEPLEKVEDEHPGLISRARERFSSVIWWDRPKGVWRGAVIDNRHPYDKRIGLLERHTCEYALHNDVIRNLMHWIECQGSWELQQEEFGDDEAQAR